MRATLSTLVIVPALLVLAPACKSENQTPVEQPTTTTPSQPPAAAPAKAEGCTALPKIISVQNARLRIIPGGKEVTLEAGKAIELEPGVVHLLFTLSEDEDQILETLTALLPGETHEFELQGSIHRAKSLCQRSALPRQDFLDATLDRGLLSEDGTELARVVYEWSGLAGIEDVSVVVEKVPGGDVLHRWEPGIDSDTSNAPSFKDDVLSEATAYLAAGKFQREGVALPEEATTFGKGELQLSWLGTTKSKPIPEKSAVEKRCCTDDYQVVSAIGIERARVAVLEGYRDCSYGDDEACVDYHEENQQKLDRHFFDLR